MSCFIAAPAAQLVVSKRGNGLGFPFRYLSQTRDVHSSALTLSRLKFSRSKLTSMHMTPADVSFIGTTVLSSDAQAEIVLRILTALTSGALVGVERRAAKAAAGLRTACLLSLGSCVFTLLSVIVGTGTSKDSRVSSQIASCVGFICAGAMNRQSSSTRRGLATAGSLWIVAALGVSAGLGLYVLSLVGALFTILILESSVFIEVMARRRIQQQYIERHEETSNRYILEKPTQPLLADNFDYEI